MEDRGIDVVCHTNLDEYRYRRWPKKLAVRPLVGDRIEAECGRVLVITSITHAMGSFVIDRGLNNNTISEKRPILKLELYKPTLRS